MKRHWLFAATLAPIALVLLAACGSGQTEETSVPATSVTPSPTLTYDPASPAVAVCSKGHEASFAAAAAGRRDAERLAGAYESTAGVVGRWLEQAKPELSSTDIFPRVKSYPPDTPLFLCYYEAEDFYAFSCPGPEPPATPACPGDRAFKIMLADGTSVLGGMGKKEVLPILAPPGAR